VRKGIYSILFVCLLFTSAVQAADICYYGIVEDYSVIADGVEWRHIEYGWICYYYDDGSGGDTGGGGDPGDGQPPQPPSPPSVRIVSVSDENPHQLTLAFEYSGAPTQMFLRKNGELVSSGSPASYGFFGSLDNMIFDSILTVTMCNAGGCADAAADVHRTTVRPRVEGAISAEWADLVPIDPYNLTIVYGSESYTRMLEVEALLADYSLPTTGQRNGRAKHVQSADALLWENGKRVPDWDTTYRLVPSWGWYEISEPASETPGCTVPQNRFPNQSPRCTVVSEFAREWYPGRGVITRVISTGNVGGNPAGAFGALEMDIWP